MPEFTVTLDIAAGISEAVVSDVNFLVPDPAQLALCDVGGFVLVSVTGSEAVLYGVITQIDPTVPGGPMVTVVV